MVAFEAMACLVARGSTSEEMMEMCGVGEKVVKPGLIRENAKLGALSQNSHTW